MFFVPEDRIHISLFTSFEELFSIQQEWDEYIEHLEGEIFLTYDWCRVWWKYYGMQRRLLIYLFRQRGALCGIIPVFGEEVGLAAFNIKVVKLVGSDFLPITMRLPIDESVSDQVMAAFIDQLKHDYDWDLLHFGALSGEYYSESCRLAALCEKIFTGSYRVQTKLSDVETYFSIAKSFEGQLKNLNKHVRQELRRDYRRCGLLESEHASACNLEERLDDFINLHQYRWKDRGCNGHFGDWPRSSEFHREISKRALENDRLRLLRINLEGHRFGYKYAFKLGHTYYSFLDAFDEPGIPRNLSFSRLAFGEQVKYAVKEGVTTIDSMRGQYKHKEHLGGVYLPVNNIYIYQQSWSKLFKVFSFRLLSTLLDILYSKIWRRRIAPQYNYKTNMFMPLWIRTSIFSLQKHRYH